MMVGAVVFDFDYTLADSSNGIVKCIQHAFNHLGLAPVPERRMRESIGLTLAATLTYLTGIEDTKAAAEFTRIFVQHADEIMADHTFFYDAAPIVLEELRSAGVSLGIVSTKYRYRIESMLQREALLPHFDIIIGGEDVQQHKPHPSSLEQALAHLACAPAQALYVGDHPVDAEAAYRAGVPFVAVLTGMSVRDHFMAFPHLALLDNLSALLPVLRRGEEVRPCGRV
jgi:phosphoglycolate phosphatase